MSVAFLSLGSNLGDRIANLQFAIRALGALVGTRIEAVSDLYETKPWGVSDQPDFLNLCLKLETDLSPYALLDALLQIERAAGRERRERWGARTLDMDILTYDMIEIADARLTLPHARMLQRSFVLKPLGELCPDLMVNSVPIERALAELGEAGIVRVGRLPEGAARDGRACDGPA
jgi:2-amino-4-hydroxy-6-hydroxymethyldihydropteridine diphosphokinase